MMSGKSVEDPIIDLISLRVAVPILRGKTGGRERLRKPGANRFL